jgi:hypothetical protein
VFRITFRYAVQRARFAGETASSRKFEMLWLKPDQKNPEPACRNTAQAKDVDPIHRSGAAAM